MKMACWTPKYGCLSPHRFVVDIGSGKGIFFNDKPPSSANRNGEDKRLMERLKYLEVPKKLHDTFLLMRDVLFCQINIFYRFIGGANHNDDQSTTM